MRVTPLRHASGALLMAAAAALLTMSGTAAAAERPDAVPAGNCAATMGIADGGPLTVDAGALVDLPARIAIGLSGEAAGGFGRVAVRLCLLAKPVVNQLGVAVQGVVPVDELIAPPDGAGATAGPPAVQVLPPPGTEPGGHEAGSATATVSGAAGPDLSTTHRSGNGAPPRPGTSRPMAPYQASLVPAVLIEPPSHAPHVTASRKGTGETVRQVDGIRSPRAFPPSGQRERLPLSLAVIALAAVAIALSRRFQHHAVT